MRRTALLATLALSLALPAASAAQVSLMGGVGVTNPLGDLNDAADVGWHALAGVQLGIATIPIQLRADGGYHSFGAQSSTPAVDVLSGALSLVVPFPGVGLSPYVLGGIGMYRTSFDDDAIENQSDTGIHGAFGVDIGAAGGFGGFAEVRFVDVNTNAEGSRRFVTATLGIRL